MERRVLAGLVNGESSKSLASFYGVALEAVKQTRQALMEKLSARTTADLVRIGIVSKVRWL